MEEKIVVVDDEKVLLHLSSMVLQNKGYEVLTAESGQECLELIERENPALALLDYMMPGMNGMETLREIRQRFPDTYVVMFTGKGNESLAVELMKAGASDYLTKPFHNADLIERIQHVLRLRSIEMHNRELRAERDRLVLEVEEWNRELESRVERKSQELKQVQAEIVETETLAALGNMSAGMAHEIRNPINSINLFATLIKSSVKETDEVHGFAERICSDVHRVDTLLQNMLTGSEANTLRPEKVNLAHVLVETVDMFYDQAKEQQVDVEVEVPEDMSFILADPKEVQLVFSNLIGNALHEMSYGGVLSIKGFEKEQTIHIDLSDTGNGIPPENLGRIFEPFFTTKDKGTGVGLWVVKRSLKAYGGSVRVQSEVGQGTTFALKFPVASD